MHEGDGFDPFDLTTETGATLSVYRRLAADPARGVVHVNHGLAEHGGRYARFAAFLAGRGYHTYAQDHRGHGRTAAPDAPRGVFARGKGWDAVLRDAHAVNAEIQARHPGAPIVVFGHSMGGTIALTYAARWGRTVQAAAIWNAQTQLGAQGRAARLVLALERLTAGGEGPAKRMTALTFDAWNRRLKPNRTAFDWLSHDEAQVDAYVADPDCGWTASVSLWGDLFDGLAEAGGAPARVRQDMPFHLLGGAEDPVTDGGRAIKQLAARLTRAGVSDVTDIVVDGARHETLNEIGAEATMTAFADWLDGALAPHSSAMGAG